MTFIEIRNTISKQLADYLGCPVVLSDQIQPVTAFPFGFYSVTTPYAPTGEQGNYEHTVDEGGESMTTKRIEQPSATFSFTFCSVNRQSGDNYIYGEDEAQAIAERAQGFFLHVAYDTLSNLGIVIVDVTNAASRTTLVVDEAARRYGFDVRVRYTRIDSRTDGVVDDVAAYSKKE